MTDTGELYLGIIAFAVLVMAAVQLGAIIAGIRLAKRVDRMAAQLDQDIRPLLASLTTLSSEAAKTAALAARQVERLDKMFAEFAQRTDQILAAAQDFVTGPARQGLAIMAGVRTLIHSFRGLREASRRRHATRHPMDDEESLFIG